MKKRYSEERVISILQAAEAAQGTRPGFVASTGSPSRRSAAGGTRTVAGTYRTRGS